MVLGIWRSFHTVNFNCADLLYGGIESTEDLKRVPAFMGEELIRMIFKINENQVRQHVTVLSLLLSNQNSQFFWKKTPFENLRKILSGLI